MNKFRKPKLTDEQENEIRRRFFKAKHDPKALCAEYHITNQTLSTIVGGPTSGRGFKPEQMYA